MSNELVRKNLENSLALGNLSELMKATEDVMLLVDVSGSMAAEIEPVKQYPGEPHRQGKRCIDALREVVNDLKSQSNEPIPMIAFGLSDMSSVNFVHDIPEPGGGTPLAAALDLAREYGANRVVVISDGIPDDQNAAMEAARRFAGRIDVVFVGVPGDHGSIFLDELARKSGGKRFEGSLKDVKAITSMVIGLLEGDVAPQRGPIQGEGFSVADEPAEVEDDEEDEDDDDDDTDEEDEEDEDDDE